LASSDRTSPGGRVRPYAQWIWRLQRLVDAAAIAVTFWGATRRHPTRFHFEEVAAVVLAVTWFQLVAPAFGLYRSWRGRRYRDESGAVLLTWLCTVPALLAAAFFTKQSEEFSRVEMFVWVVTAPLAMILVRLAVRLYLRRMRAAGRNLRRVAIAGATDLGARLVKHIEATPQAGNLVVGFYDDRTPARLASKHLAGKRLRGGLQELVDAARSGRVDIVHIALPLRAERRIRQIITALADTTATVNVATDLFIFDLMQARWDSVGDVPVVSVFDTPFEGLGGWVKRAEDIVLAFLILCLVALPMLIIGIGVKVTSKGPVFFRQNRYGLNGQPIQVLKFRTMTTMDDGSVVVQASRNDARITKFGAFLRRTSLDELPQFINVLRGDMSVVGPRPHAVAHNEMYRGRIRGYMLRHKVKPGITGWAQVNGWRGETEVLAKMESRVEHDLYYIDNWSLLWDLQIVFLTIFGRRVRSNAF